MNVSAWFPDAIIIITYSLISVENLWDSTTTPQALHYFFAVDAMTGDFAVVDEDGEDQFLHRAIYDRCLNKSLRKKSGPFSIIFTIYGTDRGKVMRRISWYSQAKPCFAKNKSGEV